MKLSEIIGTLSGALEEVTVNGETFYDTNLILNGKSLPARIPGYLSGVSGKAKICCNLESTEKNGKLFTYVNILTAERLKEQKTPDTGTMTLSAKVQKLDVIPVPSKGAISVMMRVTVVTGINTRKISTLHVTAADKVARQLANVAEKSMVDLKGSIKSFKGCLYFRVSEVLNVKQNANS